MDFNTILQILDSSVRLMTPLLLACLAGLYSERAGVFDIGLEGKMLMAAMASGAVAALSGSVWIGLFAGIGASLILAGIHGIASITFRGNQLISGVALNFIASGITVLVAQALFGQRGQHQGMLQGLGHRGLHGVLQSQGFDTTWASLWLRVLAVRGLVTGDTRPGCNRMQPRRRAQSRRPHWATDDQKVKPLLRRCPDSGSSRPSSGFSGA